MFFQVLLVLLQVNPRSAMQNPKNSSVAVVVLFLLEGIVRQKYCCFCSSSVENIRSSGGKGLRVIYINRSAFL